METMGFAVCDADRVAHRLMKKGEPVYRRIVGRFGTGILAEDGEIARPVLGQLVFEDPRERTALERLVHPPVRRALERWIAAQRKGNASAAALIPLLFESGMDDLDFDAVVCVSSGEEQMLRRLEARGMGRGDALKRIRAQMPLAEKEARSDRVVPNRGTLQELEEAVRRTVKRIELER